jgi:hypothetical protein
VFKKIKNSKNKNKCKFSKSKVIENLLLFSKRYYN